MHNHPSGPAPEFISLQSTTTNSSGNNSTTVNAGDNVTTAEGSRHFSKRGRGGSITSSHRGRYGPPSLPRGLVNSTRTKRKREPTSAESGEEQATTLHLEITKMPWHPLGFTRYSPGIIG